VIEIHLDSPTGPVIGKTNLIEVSQGGFGGPPAAATPGKGAPLGTAVAASAAPAAAPAAGTPATAAPAQQAPRRPAPSSQKVAIQATAGEHDVYFVAVNPKATEQQIVVQIQGIEMKK
jgi:cytochrome c